MDIDKKEVLRATRDFSKAINSLQAAGSQLYQTRVNEFIYLIRENRVLYYIIGPYLKMEVNFKEIENERGGWFDLRLPSNQDLQIAYVLQVMNQSIKGDTAIDTYALHIFRQTNINSNLAKWNQQILFPCLDILQDKINDLIEDEVDVEGKEEVSTASLQIINYGNITSEKGNIAIGKDITQTFTMGELSNELIKQALEKNLITEEQVDEVKTVTDAMEIELQDDNPNPSKLKQFAEKLYGIGSKGLLSLTTAVVTNPHWGEAVTTFLFSLI